MSPFVDISIPKGVSMREVTHRLDLLLERRTARLEMIS